MTVEAVPTGKEVTGDAGVTGEKVVDAVVPVVQSKADKQGLSCSEPSPSALLVALSPVFALKPIRPVNNMYNYTEVLVSFTLFGILGVVCSV